MVKEFISQLSPDKLTPFEKHPYQVREDTAMDELVESIRVHGVLSPLLARPKGEGYELVSGHRRRLAAQKLGRPTVPVLVREMTDDEAVILMVDSNLQRENLLPSEKAFAYKMKLEAMKRQAGRRSKNSPQLAANLRTDDEIAKQAGISGDTVRRYIRLTNLVPPLLQMVDDGADHLKMPQLLCADCGSPRATSAKKPCAARVTGRKRERKRKCAKCRLAPFL